MNLVADFDRREDQRNRRGSEHVVLADPGSAHQRMQAQALGNSNARGCVDENHGLPGADVRGAHGERPKRAAADVLPEPSPANVSAHQSGKRSRVEHAARLAGAAEKDTIKTSGLTKAKAEDVGELKPGPDRDELIHGTWHIADRRSDEGTVDGADARPGNQVDLRPVPLGIDELAEDVLESPNLVRSSRTASRKYQAKTTHDASSSFKPISQRGLSQKSSLLSSSRISGGSQMSPWGKRRSAPSRTSARRQGGALGET